MSPEGLSHAMTNYVASLEHQAETAKAFFIGSLTEGLAKLNQLPDEIRTQIEQLVWQITGGENPTPDIIAAAILHSLEGRMGITE
jgi:hypothetical protein